MALFSHSACNFFSEPVTEKSVEDFIAEIELMKKIGEHENIIQMLGCCTLTLPIGLIMEYAPHGNLLTYLRTVKTKVCIDIMKLSSIYLRNTRVRSVVHEGPLGI